MFEIIYSVDVKNDRNTIYKGAKRGELIDDIEGFALWYLNKAPTKNDLDVSFGFKPEFHGLGIYFFKHQG